MKRYGRSKFIFWSVYENQSGTQILEHTTTDEHFRGHKTKVLRLEISNFVRHSGYKSSRILWDYLQVRVVSIVNLAKNCKKCV